MRKKDIEKIVGASSASIAQRQSNQPRKLEDLGSIPGWGIFSILADDAPTIFYIRLMIAEYSVKLKVTVWTETGLHSLVWIYIYIYIDWMRKIYIYILKKLLERHLREWKKCLNSDSNQDPPAYAADCSAVELLRPQLLRPQFFSISINLCVIWLP